MEQIRTKPATKKYRENYDRIFKRAGVAQSVEQLPCKQTVGGSRPPASSRLTNTTTCVNNDPHFGG